MPKLPRRPWKMVISTETKSLWTGPNLRVKVALVAEKEADVALEAELVAEAAEMDLVAEAGRLWRARRLPRRQRRRRRPQPQGKKMSLNSFFYPCLSLFHWKERTLGFLLCYLINDRAF